MRSSPRTSSIVSRITEVCAFVGAARDADEKPTGGAAERFALSDAFLRRIRLPDFERIERRGRLGAHDIWKRDPGDNRS